MIPVLHPELPQFLSPGRLAGWRFLRLLLKARGNHNEHPRLIEEKNPEDAVEIFDPQLEYLIPQLLHELSCIRLPWMRRRSINASIRAAALSSSESTNSRAGVRPLGNSTYSTVNSAPKPPRRNNRNLV